MSLNGNNVLYYTIFRYLEQQNEQLKTLRGVWPEVIEDDDLEMYTDDNTSKIYNFDVLRALGYQIE